MTQLAMLRRLSDVVEEYDAKVVAIPEAVKAFEQAGSDLKSASTVGGTWGQTQIDTGRVYAGIIQDSLKASAWQHIYNGLQIDRIASANDKQRFKQTMASPPPFTLDNLRATFGGYVSDPWGNILRGLAEVFCDLDPAYKSHDKVKIGVAGLPKRIILGNVASYGWGKDRLENVLNALASIQGKPLITWRELYALLNREDALLVDGEFPADRSSPEPVKFVGRGVRLRRFGNGNAHLFFEPDTLRDINRALAEYYGEVLADCSDDGEESEKRQSTAVTKDLQYYPTPKEVVARVVADLYPLEGQRILEPSCGCGRFMDALRSKGATVIGCEVDLGRAAECKAKGHRVIVGNFLETVSTGDYDRVVMNPPFYGQHYAKHVRHALKFLKPGGVLTAILPITARYDHGALDDVAKSSGRLGGSWSDLPVGSFRESGTNINTTVLTVKVPA